MRTRTLLTVAAAGSLALVIGVPAGADDLKLTGIVRDLRRGDQTGGHPDFETTHTVSGHGDYGHVINLTTMYLGTDTKPVFATTRPSNDTIKSATTFRTWFNDDPAVNMSKPLTLTLSNSPGAPDIYSYATNAFFPIDAQMLGNQGQKDANGTVHNFSFTFELHTGFTYRPGQAFTFVGDDDVWVYVNRNKVIDLGGVHSGVTGTVVLLDGKAFITNQGGSTPTDTANQKPFPTGGVVQAVSSTQAGQMATLWSTLGLAGTCPVKSGQKFIDLNLNSGAGDVRCVFHGTSVDVYCGNPAVSAVLLFTDGTQQRVSNLGGTHHLLVGSGAYASKTIAGVYVKTGTVTGDGPRFNADGSGGTDCTLDFFFAERHTTESNFRIDTSMLLKAKPTATVSAAYD